jgi:hypothetical protein
MIAANTIAATNAIASSAVYLPKQHTRARLPTATPPTVTLNERHSQ